MFCPLKRISFEQLLTPPTAERFPRHFISICASSFLSKISGLPKDIHNLVLILLLNLSGLTVSVFCRERTHSRCRVWGGSGPSEPCMYVLSQVQEGAAGDHTIHFAVHQQVLLGVKLSTLSLPNISEGHGPFFLKNKSRSKR